MSFFREDLQIKYRNTVFFHRNFDCWPILGIYYARIDQKSDYVLTEGSGRKIYFRILLVLIDDFPVSEEIDCTSGINPV